MVKQIVRRSRVGRDAIMNVYLGGRGTGRAVHPEDRRTMLNALRHIWIDGVLERSIYRRTVLELGLEDRPDMVDNPWDVHLEEPDHTPVPLERGVTPGHVLRTRRSLLIVGAPGAGKSTMLLQLLRELLDEAEDETKPIPVVFHLGSWQGETSLRQWLVDGLTATPYSVPPDVARLWVEERRILPLLDGLDEVALEHRVACARAIDAFHAEDGLLPVVVCSRVAEYATLGFKLGFKSALHVQPLTRSQVDGYLDRFGAPLAGMREALGADPTLWELLQTPFLLGIAVRAYEGLPAEEISLEHGPLPDRRTRLIDAFVDRTLRGRPGRSQLDRRQVVRWLAYTARALGVRLETVFHIEMVTRSWLPLGKMTLVTAATTLPLVALTGTLCYLLTEMVFDRSQAISFTTVVAVLAGVGGLVSEHELKGPVGGGRAEQLVSTLREMLAIASGLATVSALGGGVIGAFAAGIAHAPIRSSDLMVVGDYAVRGAFFLALVAILLVFADPVLATRREFHEFPPGKALSLESRLGLDLTLAIGVPAALIFGILNGGPGALAGGLLGVCAGYLCVGRRLVGYWCTRVLLASDGLLPLRYLRFLDLAVSRMLLIQIGGGHRFYHRLLLEYFAGLDLEDVPDGYRQGGLPVADMTPEVVLSNAQTSKDHRLVLKQLRYAGNHVPVEEFAPAAFEAARKMIPEPDDDGNRKADQSLVDIVVSAHRLVFNSGHLDLSPAAAFEVAEFLYSLTSAKEAHIRRWWKTAEEFYRLAIDSEHPIYAPAAKKNLERGPSPTALRLPDVAPYQGHGPPFFY
ncbi:NACHT domain-containing protein [Actinomadura spongiicola]|uniref:NACHT domain-containing protein n=1 Tax=Actinomadura spongiicola TaxID=2303421 RepID=UPI00131424CD|nr:NACHT domain-containing protein [Actinomadura spongiicola]